MIDTDIAIIGAGPYGLSLAAHLRSRGVSFIIVGKPMESWRTFMPTDMILKSEPFASNLWDRSGDFTLKQYRMSTGAPFRPIGDPLRLKDFLAYADWFRARAIPEIRPALVASLRRENDGRYVMDLDDGATIRAREAVLATGHMPFQNMPGQLADLPPELASHSAVASDVAAFKGKDVTVLGLGQSALEHAALLREAGAHVCVIGREETVAWNGLPRVNPGLVDSILAPEAGLGAGWRGYLFSEFPRLFKLLPDETRLRIVRNGWGPSGAWWLRERVDGKLPLLTGHRLTSATERGGRVVLQLIGVNGAREIETDHVIAATGFKVDFNRLSFIDPALRARVALIDGSPALSRRFETSAPGLYAMGVMSAATFGPVMRFMYGAKHAAPALTRRLSARAARTGQPTLAPTYS